MGLCHDCGAKIYVIDEDGVEECKAHGSMQKGVDRGCCGDFVCANERCDCVCDRAEDAKDAKAANASDTESDTDAPKRERIASAKRMVEAATAAALEASLAVAISNAPAPEPAAAKEKSPSPSRKEKAVECLDCALEQCYACSAWVYVSESGRGCDLHGEMQEGSHCQHCSRSTCATCGCACDGCSCDLFACAHCLSECYQLVDDSCHNPKHAGKTLSKTPGYCDTCFKTTCGACKAVCSDAKLAPASAKAPAKAPAAAAASAAAPDLTELKKRVEDRKRKIEDMQKKSAAETMARVTEERKAKKAKLDAPKGVPVDAVKGTGKTEPKSAKTESTMDTNHVRAPLPLPLPLPIIQNKAVELSKADEDELLSRFDARQAFEKRRALLRRYFSRQKEKDALKGRDDVVMNSETEFEAEPCFCKEVTCYVCHKEERVAVATEVPCKTHSTTRMPDRALICTRCARYCCAWECAERHAKVCEVSEHLYS